MAAIKSTKIKDTKSTTPAPSNPSAVFYSKGADYNPRCPHNIAAWEAVSKAIDKGKGKASHADLCVALKNHHTKEGNHHDFIGYLASTKSRKAPVLILSK